MCSNLVQRDSKQKQSSIASVGALAQKNIKFTLPHPPPVDPRQLRPELRAEQAANGHLGHPSGPSHHVQQSGGHQARDQGYPAEQEGSGSQSGPIGHPRTTGLRGTFISSLVSL